MASWLLGKSHLSTAFVLLALAAILIVVLLKKGPQHGQDKSPTRVEEVPGLSFLSPYRNTRPEVAYVSDATCAECHADKAESFRMHPMGRSLAAVASVARHQRYDAPVHNPFQAVGATFAVECRDDRVFHKEMRFDLRGKLFAEATEEVQYVIGSGVHNYSYLLERDGLLVQSPITFYSQKALWDLSPGYANRGNYFERPVMVSCLFCHANRVEPVAETINRYRPPIFRDGAAIGCQRCHGPGALHVERRERLEVVQGADDSIVNPRRLRWELREGICQQCHLEGVNRIQKRGRELFDYRPGLPWQMFWTVFVSSEKQDDAKFDSSVEQLYASRCFQASKGRMGCTTCHDPHRLPEPVEKMTYYRQRCLQCHDEKAGCSLALEARKQKSPKDDCVACHMPSFSSSDIPHTAVTNHRIPRRQTAAAAAPQAGGGGIPWRPFLSQIEGYEDSDMSRALAILLIDQVKYHDASKTLIQTALPLLEQALQDWQDDLPALEAKAEGLDVLGRSQAALATYDTILAKAPRRETTLDRAATVARSLGMRDTALEYRRRLLDINPTSLSYRMGMANVLAERGDWQQAVAMCQAILQDYPPNLKARLVLLNYYLLEGDRAAARTIFDQVVALHPDNEEQLRQWFAERMK